MLFPALTQKDLHETNLFLPSDKPANILGVVWQTYYIDVILKKVNRSKAFKAKKT